MSTEDPLAAWDYPLPPDRIAAFPAEPRESARLLRFPRAAGSPCEHHHVGDLPELLAPGDLLVVNNSRVMAARLEARRATGGAVELLLLEPGPGPVRALAKPARRLKVGEVLDVQGVGQATVLARPDAEGLLRVETRPEPEVLMAAVGELPLPPYIGRRAEASDAASYQTVYAGPLGSAAAPTAGLHFTPGLIAALGERGVQLAEVTLHVGIGTFRPLRPEDLARGRLHTEPVTVPETTVAAIEATRARGGRVIAVGTTSARTLESGAQSGPLRAGSWTTDLFIQPPYTPRVIDGLITNFHLPRSSLLCLVGALVGRERLLAAYAEASRLGYRFYSYGDAMLIL